MWLARRSATKAIDPGLLDNLVGGGIASGITIVDTVVKESWEEAGILTAMATQATRARRAHRFREQRDGIQHETIYAHDLWLPPDWTPANQDGEAVEHRLVTLAEAADIVGSETPPDVMTADASLVALDCLVRLGAMEPRDSFARLSRGQIASLESECGRSAGAASARMERSNRLRLQLAAHLATLVGVAVHVEVRVAGLEFLQLVRRQLGTGRRLVGVAILRERNDDRAVGARGALMDVRHRSLDARGRHAARHRAVVGDGDGARALAVGLDRRHFLVAR
jgi:8-oxo-dGTP pyrophosphatase MutT (NUDIX family)